MHGQEPLLALNFPAGQAEQLLPAAPVNPALQAHASIEILPSGDELSMGQMTQVPGDEVRHPLRYLPASHFGQLVHAPGEEPLHPAKYWPSGHESAHDTHVPGVSPEQPLR